MSDLAAEVQILAQVSCLCLYVSCVPGRSCTQLKSRGRSCTQLKSRGRSCTQLKSRGRSCTQLKSRGRSCTQHKSRGRPCTHLKSHGRSRTHPPCTHQLAVPLRLLSGQDTPTYMQCDIHNLASMLAVFAKDSWCIYTVTWRQWSG